MDNHHYASFESPKWLSAWWGLWLVSQFSLSIENRLAFMDADIGLGPNLLLVLFSTLVTIAARFWVVKKTRMDTNFHGSVIEPFIEGDAVRVVVIGDEAWQVRLEGDGWLKSIHHDTAKLESLDADLLADTRVVAAGMGLEIAANDYLVDTSGTPHLLELNHIPNVTRFPEIWDGYRRHVLRWLDG